MSQHAERPIDWLGVTSHEHGAGSHETGGPQAVSDLWRAGFPIALISLVATYFKPLSPDQHGIAAVLEPGFGMLVQSGLLLSLFS